MRQAEPDRGTLGVLTVHSSLSRFAARLNSGVRPTGDIRESDRRRRRAAGSGFLVPQ